MNSLLNIVRPLASSDSVSLALLIDNAEFLYRHLDWRTPQDWLGTDPFFGIESRHHLQAALACPLETPPIAWIRFFGFLGWSTAGLKDAWICLLEKSIDRHKPNPDTYIAGLGLNPWSAQLMQETGFFHRQDILVLQWRREVTPQRHLPSDITLRPMAANDLSAVARIDALAFDTLWRHSQADLDFAFKLAAYATVAELEGEIIAYQISTGTPFHAHLARLAVDPGLQRLSIGYCLVQDLIKNFSNREITNITVNTQSDNQASLALYQKLGFQLNGEAFPVYMLKVQ